jgi:hypothetical protein
MRSGIVLLLAIVLCFCTGCATYYYREGSTFEQAQEDLADCRAELQKRVTNEKAGDYEYKFMEDCMRHKGYDLVTEDKLPLSVKREDPDTSMHGFLYGRRHGLAGSVEQR